MCTTASIELKLPVSCLFLFGAGTKLGIVICFVCLKPSQLSAECPPPCSQLLSCSPGWQHAGTGAFNTCSRLLVLQVQTLKVRILHGDLNT